MKYAAEEGYLSILQDFLRLDERECVFDDNLRCMTHPSETPMPCPYKLARVILERGSLDTELVKIILSSHVAGKIAAVEAVAKDADNADH